jgi:hypothetical protein
MPIDCLGKVPTRRSPELQGYIDFAVGSCHLRRNATPRRTGKVPLAAPRGSFVVSLATKKANVVDLQLARKTALVTGASQGMGRAIAIGLAAEGVHVARDSDGSLRRPGGIRQCRRLLCIAMWAT